MKQIIKALRYMGDSLHKLADKLAKGGGGGGPQEPL